MNFFSKQQGISGKQRESQGKTLLVEVPIEKWERIETALEIHGDLVEGSVVMRYLKIGKKTLCNLVSCGKIKRHMYKVAVTGVKFFHLQKILGIKK